MLSICINSSEPLRWDHTEEKISYCAGPGDGSWGQGPWSRNPGGSNMQGGNGAGPMGNGGGGPMKGDNFAQRSTGPYGGEQLEF